MGCGYSGTIRGRVVAGACQLRPGVGEHYILVAVMFFATYMFQPLKIKHLDEHDFPAQF